MSYEPNHKVIGIIPARFGSKRFPGKTLADINGKTLVQCTYENALLSKSLEALYVATDDQRIMEAVVNFGGRAILTSPSCPTGSDRLAEVLRMPEFSEVEVVMNIQGDEPCLEPEVIDQVIAALISDPLASMSTACMPIHSQEESDNPNCVKCVLDLQGNALYFSRARIPAGFDCQLKNYNKHLGVYAYRKEFLLHYAALPPTPLQLAEDLEQLKVLEHGFRIKVAKVNSQSIGVDTPEDLIKVKSRLCRQNTYLSQVESVPH
jgi:3-deoxy-manno-octulosonate cytidylyltransferase (CMP-KDO synthetase)